ncbi:hypothetical protein D3C72_748790 [compost metagenome]
MRGILAYDHFLERKIERFLKAGHVGFPRCSSAFSHLGCDFLRHSWDQAREG